MRSPNAAFCWHVVAFAALALLLAAMGVYAVTSHVVRARTRELSIRAALGARAGHLIWLAIRDGLVVAGIGGCLGVLGLRAVHSAARGISVRRQPMGLGNVPRGDVGPDSRRRRRLVCPRTQGRASRSTDRLEVDVTRAFILPLSRQFRC